MTHTPGLCLSKLSAAEFTLLENAGWTHDELALAMPQELADAVRKERLTAAAPDLLAACEMFTAGARDAVRALNAAGISCPASIALAAEKARAAIAKARGE